MESTDKTPPESGKPVSDFPASVSDSQTRKFNYFLVDFCIRVVLFVSTLIAVLVMVTSKQTQLVPVTATLMVPQSAKFNNSPAFIYFVAALSVTCLYSIITSLASLMAISKPHLSNKLLFHFAMFDVLILGLVASATGTAGGVAYIGLKGNSHVRWQKICSTYDKFCLHVGGSVAVSVFASTLLVLLLMLSIFSLQRRSHRLNV